jgi:CTP:molybdopterin cytidylyltransferase MocA
MPVTTTKAAAHIMAGNDPQLTENASAKLARKRMEAQRAAEALHGYDRATPLISAADAEQDAAPLFPGSEPTEPTDLPCIEIQTTVEHRGRAFTVVSRGYTLDQLCDMLDKRGYTAAAQTQEWQTLPDGTPICPKHHTPMRKRERQGDTWYSHSAGKDASGKDVYCKGYHGKDSPGYEVD